MHMRRTLGISLAFLVMSAGAMAETPEKSKSHHPGQPHGAKPQKAEHQTGNRLLASSRAMYSRSSARYATHHTVSSRYRHAIAPPIADDSRGAPDPYLPTGREFAGK